MQMIAKKKFKYAGQKLVPGDSFEAKSNSHGRVLRAARLAEDAGDGATETKPARRRGRPPKVKAEATYETRVLTAED